MQSSSPPSGPSPGVRRSAHDAIERTSELESPFVSVPGVGPELAQRIERKLGIHTLEQLELAAHTGRLQTVAGIGAGRARRVRDALKLHFDGAHQAESKPGAAGPNPPVGDILTIDHEYRHKARVGLLARVAPKRFNPTGAAWLPVLRTTLNDVRYTAFFSNSATAHRAHKTHQWVIVLAERDGHRREFTVVSDTHGDFRGERVVRGREPECRQYYAHSHQAA